MRCCQGNHYIKNVPADLLTGTMDPKSQGRIFELPMVFHNGAFSQTSHLLGPNLGPLNSCSAVPGGHLSIAPPQWGWVAAQKAVGLLLASSAAPTELLTPGMVTSGL